jgi:uncharacterized membrane protein YphA (DoxX/SURF4 family)
MNIALWIAQVLLALDFGIHGWEMVSLTMTPLMGFTYIVDIPSRTRRFVGAAEILAAFGLILPGLTGILPWLTPLAAVGLIIVMIGAISFHFRRKEYANIGLNVILLALALFVAYGRFVVLPL